MELAACEEGKPNGPPVYSVPSGWATRCTCPSSAVSWLGRGRCTLFLMRLQLWSEMKMLITSAMMMGNVFFPHFLIMKNNKTMYSGIQMKRLETQ